MLIRNTWLLAFRMALIMLPAQFILAQESNTVPEGKNATEQESSVSRHSIGISINHARVFSGRDELGNNKKLSLAAWAIDYNYHLNPKWAIGLHTDIIFESFVVKRSDGVTIERSNPIAPALMGIFKPARHWSLLAGIGGEFTKEENLFLTRFGVEYNVEIRNRWELFGTFSYDIKWNAYDTWVLGMGVSKGFGKLLPHK